MFFFSIAAKSTDLGRVIGGVAGGLLIAIIVLIAFIIFKRKTGNCKSVFSRKHSLKKEN